jgi:hypothetical protein
MLEELKQKLQSLWPRCQIAEDAVCQVGAESLMPKDPNCRGTQQLFLVCISRVFVYLFHFYYV